jgi:hypothetical protein
VRLDCHARLGALARAESLLRAPGLRGYRRGRRQKIAKSDLLGIRSWVIDSLPPARERFFLDAIVAGHGAFLMKVVRVIVLSAVAVLLTARAEASLITFTNLASFQAAAGATSLENFSGAVVGFSTANFSGSFNRFSLSSVSNGDNSGISTGSMSGSDNTAIPAAFAGQSFYGWGNVDGNAGPTSTFTFAAGTTAFGFDWFNTDQTDTYSLTINGQTFVAPPFSLASAAASSGFFGVVATGGETFTSATIQTNSFGGFVSTEGLDNVRVSTVPEPATMSLLAVGLGGFGLRKLRGRRTS